MSEGKVFKPGDPVIVVDEYGNKHNGLVTAYWDYGRDEPGKALNAVYVSEDKTKSDPYGQQIERLTSLSLKSDATAHGRYYEVP